MSEARNEKRRQRVRQRAAALREAAAAGDPAAIARLAELKAAERARKARFAAKDRERSRWRMRRNRAIRALLRAAVLIEELDDKRKAAEAIASSAAVTTGKGTAAVLEVRDAAATSSS